MLCAAYFDGSDIGEDELENIYVSGNREIGMMRNYRRLQVLQKYAGISQL